MDARVPTRIGLGAALLGMGIGHFTPAMKRGMAAMIPPRLRGHGLLSPKSLVAFTGVCELAAAVGMQVPATRRPAGVALMVFFVAVFPANAYAAKYPERFGATAVPFWPRLATQLALIGLAGWSTLTRRRA